MFLSIVIPVYNAEKYLLYCFDSLAGQNVPNHHYEVLFIDDGSTDGSGKMLAQLAAEKENVRVFSQEHRGVSAARNRGIEEARGAYIWFVDADDFVASGALGLVEKALMRSEPDRLVFRAHEFYDSLSRDELDALRRTEIPPNGGLHYVSACCSVFLKEFLMKTGVRFRENLETIEDSMFLFEFSMMKPKEASLESVLYFYRRNLGSSTMGVRIHSNSENLDSFLTVSGIAYQYYQDDRGSRTTAANLMMSNLWMYLHLCTGMDHKAFAAGVRRSYMTQRKDWVGKAFDYVYLHMNHYWGLFLMRGYQTIRKCKNEGRSSRS